MLLFQTDLSTQIERIYEFDNDPGIPRAKHLIRPLLTYSYIPFIREDKSHPFLQQISTAQQKGITGYNFDNNDIVPVGYSPSGANYFVPIGHSLSYGLTTQWVRRRGAVDYDSPTYQNAIEFSAGQAVNFLEFYSPQDPSNLHPLTRFFSILNLTFDRFLSSTTYYYYPDIPPETPRHTISTSATFILERGDHGLFSFDRSISLGYNFNQVNGETSNLTGTLNFSISDYLMPYGSMSYGFATRSKASQIYGASAGIQLQSPSQCWRFATALNYNVVTGFGVGFDLKINLTGTGFGGIGDFASQLVSK